MTAERLALFPRSVYGESPHSLHNGIAPHFAIFIIHDLALIVNSQMYNYVVFSRIFTPVLWFFHHIRGRFCINKKFGRRKLNMPIRDTYGNIMVKQVGNRILDNNGSWVYEIRGDRIYDTGGNWKYELRGNRIYDTGGTWRYEIRGDRIYDTNGKWLGEDY